MLAIIRIKGAVGLRKPIKETLERLRLRRKYVCVLIEPGKENLGMVKRVKDFISFGEVSKETLIKLVEKRGQLLDKTKKIDAKKIVEEIEKGKKLENLNLKPFFRLHPPRGGIESKKHFGVGKGVLGDNKDSINKLIERML
jgi:large subunit ribosomal protein L30